MLVLSRKVGESVIVGDVRITVQSQRRGMVQISIEAPDDVEIFRAEKARPGQPFAPEAVIAPNAG